MLQLLKIGSINVLPQQFVPPFLESLVAAANRGEDLLPYIQGIVVSFGFESFEYGVSTTPHPDKYGRTCYFSTIPNWIARYDRLGYIEIDPRVSLTCKSAIPLVWDQASLRNIGPRVDDFLEDAREHGIASGVSFMWHGAYDTAMCVTLNSSIPLNNEIRAKAIARNLPDIVMFGHYFHEIFMLPAIEFGKQPQTPIGTLSTRERECITLAASGMTTKDISHKLEISSRTVQFHFEKIFTKLRASNRQEAVARAVQTGIVRT
jgi:LuxR family transcriptional regulator, quorum-sensing system regulator SolR